jgi:hypothetical protein
MTPLDPEGSAGPQEPPLTPKYRATARMVKAWDLTWEQATHAVEHTTTGGIVLVQETIREMGRLLTEAVRKAAKR